MNYFDKLIYEKAIAVLEQHKLNNAVIMFEKLPEMREALAFYATNGAGCRLIHSGGNGARNALADDGGKMAASAINVSDQEGS